MFVSASFGTFVCALVLTVRTVVADAKPPSLSPSVTHHDVLVKKKIKTLKVEPILTDLNAGRRSVLLLSALPTCFLVIVSAPGQKDLTGAVVFDQPPETFNGTSVTLNPPVLFTDKWPKVPGVTSGLPFTVTDSTGTSYLVIANKDKIQLLNLKTDDFTDGQWSTQLYGHLFDQTLPLSSKTVTFFAFSHGATSNILVTENAFIGPMVSSTEIATEIDHASFCQSNQEQILLSKDGCKTSVISWAEWNITTGFVDSSSAYLVNSANPSIIKFDQAVLQPQYPTVSFTSIAFSSFWRKGVIPTTTPPTPPTTHHVKTSHLILYCSIGGSLLLLFIVIAFCFCFCESKPKQPSMATPSPEKAAAPGVTSAPKFSHQEDAYSPYIVPSDVEQERKDIANMKFTFPPSVSENDRKVKSSKLPISSFVGPVLLAPTSYLKILKGQTKGKGKGKAKVDSLMETLYRDAKQTIAELPTVQALEYQESLPWFKKRQAMDLVPKKKVSKGRAGSSSRKLNAPARKRSSGKVAPPSGKTSSASVISKVSLAKKRSTGKGVSGKRASGKTSPKGKK